MRCQVISLICILCLPICFISCGGGGDLGPCAGTSCNEDGSNYGTINLNDSNAHWLQFCPKAPSFKEVKFKNDNGFTFTYSTSKQKTYSKIVLTSHPHPNSSCCSYQYLTDSYQQQMETATYKPLNKGLDISLSRKLLANAIVTGKDSLVQPSTLEYLLLSVSGVHYEIICDSTFAGAKQIFHPQLTLRNKTFQSVFHIFDTEVDTTRILPKEFYYSENSGIIGYYLTNGELWIAE